MSGGAGFAIRRLTPADAPAYRALMLRAYELEPEAFTSTVPERRREPPEFWEARVAAAPVVAQMVLGATANRELVGVAGLRFRARERARHKATLFGMFVEPGWRRRGVGGALVDAALAAARARPGTRTVLLTVSEGNAGALALYFSRGFRPFGTEPFANRHGERFVSLVHMWRPLDDPLPGPGL